RREPDTGLHGVEPGRAVALEAIRHHILARQETCGRDRLQHRCRSLRLALQGPYSRDWAPDPSNGLRVGPPRRRQKAALVHQGLALPRGLARAHPALPMLDLAQGATRRPRHAYGVLALVATARRLAPPNAVWLPQLLR